MFALLDVVLFAGVVGDGTAADTDGTADEGAFAASGDGTDDCTSGCGAADDLGAGVVAVVAAGLGALGALMLVVMLVVALCRDGENEGGGDSGESEREAKVEHGV